MFLVLVLLAAALTGRPGVTGPVPAFTYFLSGLVMLPAAFFFGRYGHPLPRLSLMAVLLLSAAGLSLLNTPSIYLSANSLAALVGFVGVLLVLELAVSTRQAWLRVVGGSTAILLASALHGLYCWRLAGLGVPLRSTFTNPDCYSVVPLIGVFLGLGLSVEGKYWLRVFGVVTTLVCLTALTLTGARSGMLGLMVGYGAFLLPLFASRSASLRQMGIRLFLVPLVLILVLVVSGTSLRVVERFERLGRGHDPTAVRARWDVWRHAPQALAKQPLIGNGLGCFALAYQQVRPASSAQEAYMNVAHNDYIQLLVETGLLGGLLWIALLGGAAWTVWRSFRSPTPRVAAMLGAVVGLTVYQLGNFAVPVPADWIWVGAVLGLSGALARVENPQPASTHLRLAPVVLVLAGLGIWTTHWGYRCWRVERWTGGSQQALQQLDWEQAVHLLNLAVRMQPSNFQAHLALAECNRRAFVFSGQNHWLDAENQALEAAYRANPLNPKAILARIQSLEEQGRAANAESLVVQAEKLAPYSPLVRRARARNQILQGDVQGAARTLARLDGTGIASDERALAQLLVLLETRRKDKSLLWQQLAQQDKKRAVQLGLQAAEIARKGGQLELALRFLQQVREVTPQDPAVQLQVALVRGESGDHTGESVLLERLRKASNDYDEALQQRIWQRWAAIQLEKGELDLLLVQLEDYLITRPRENWARVMISSIYLKRDQRAEARSSLRAGLPYDDDGLVRVTLGDLCARQGLTELARSYYREALPLVKSRALVEGKLKSLKNALDRDGDSAATI